MEVITYDDVESVKFIHGPKIITGNEKNVKFLLCNRLEYLIFLEQSQIFIYNVNDFLKNSNNSTYFEICLSNIKESCLKILDIPQPFSKVSHMLLDYSSLLLTVILDKKILFYDLSCLNQNYEWKTIDHNGIKLVNWTAKNDLIIIENDGSCKLYHYNSHILDFVRIQLSLKDSDKFKLVEDCKNNNNDMSFILVTKNNKNIVLITNELYDKILSSDSNLFVIPESFVINFENSIHSIRENAFSVHIEHSDSKKFLDYFHIISIKFLSLENLDYISIILVGGVDYLDGYVLFFNIKNLKIEICSYSINDLSFDNINAQDFEQLEKLSCTAIWIKEWEILFLGSPYFSQIVLFTCNRSHVNTKNVSSLSMEWLRLGMSEGYDINCTDFEIGVFDANICTCYRNIIRDPKSTIDSEGIKNPPLIFVSQTNGEIIVHYIGGSANFNKFNDYIHKTPIDIQLSIKNINSKDKDSSLFNSKNLAHESSKERNNFSTCSSKADNAADGEYRVVDLDLIAESKKKDSSCSLVDLKLFCNMKFNENNKLSEALFNSIFKIEEQVLSIEKSFEEIFFNVENIKKSSFHSHLTNIDQFIKNYTPLNTPNQFDTLLIKYNEIMDSERQLKKLYFGITKKFSEEIYKDINLEDIRDRFRKNELTSNQISILFELNNREILEFLKYPDMYSTKELRDSLIITERQCLKLASRISQVSKFCQKLNLKTVQNSEIILLPPPATEQMKNFSKKSNYNITSDSIFTDKNCQEELIFSKNIDLISNVRIFNKERNLNQCERLGNLNYSPIIRKAGRVSDVINNISNSISLKTENLRSSIGSLRDLNSSLNSQRNSPFFTATQPNSSSISNRYSNIHSKPARLSIDNFSTKDYSPILIKGNSEKASTPYFSLNWTPDLNKQNSPLSYYRSIEHVKGTPFNQRKSLNMPCIFSSSIDVIKSLFEICYEKLERILDQCDMAQDSVSFMKRENLISKNIYWKNLKLASNLFEYNVDSSESRKFTYSQIMLSKYSLMQKNMLYRQKLLLVLTNHLENSIKKEESNETLPCFGKYYYSGDSKYSDFLDNRIYNKFELKDELKDSKNIDLIESNQEDCKFKNLEYSIDTLKKLEVNKIDNFDPLNKKADDCNLKLSNEDSKKFNNFKHHICTDSVKKVISEDFEIQNLDKNKSIQDNVFQSDLSNHSYKNMDYKNNSEIQHENLNLSQEVEKSNFEFNNPNNEDKSKNLLTNLQNKNNLISKKLDTSLFPINISETPNSKKASEGIFTFSTEMNTSLNLAKVFSAKNITDEQPSNESNIFSFSSDNTPLKPINNLDCIINLESKTTNQSVEKSYEKTEHNMMETNKNFVKEIDVETIKDEVTINTFDDSNSKKSDISTSNIIENNFKSNSLSNNIGILGLNSFINTSPAPKISGFGSSQFLTTGPFSSNTDFTQTQSSNKIFSISDLGPNQQDYSFGLSSSKLSNSTPFASQPSVESHIGGFTSFSKQFQGFSSTLISNSTDSFFNLASNNCQFNFAPPPKPRQVNKLD